MGNETGIAIEITDKVKAETFKELQRMERYQKCKGGILGVTQYTLNYEDMVFLITEHDRLDAEKEKWKTDALGWEENHDNAMKRIVEKDKHIEKLKHQTCPYCGKSYMDIIIDPKAPKE